MCPVLILEGIRMSQNKAKQKKKKEKKKKWLS